MEEETSSNNNNNSATPSSSSSSSTNPPNPYFQQQQQQQQQNATATTRNTMDPQLPARTTTKTAQPGSVPLSVPIPFMTNAAAAAAAAVAFPAVVMTQHPALHVNAGTVQPPPPLHATHSYAQAQPAQYQPTGAAALAAATAAKGPSSTTFLLPNFCVNSQQMPATIGIPSHLFSSSRLAGRVAPTPPAPIALKRKAGNCDQEEANDPLSKKPRTTTTTTEPSVVSLYSSDHPHDNYNNASPKNMHRPHSHTPAGAPSLAFGSPMMPFAAVPCHPPPLSIMGDDDGGMTTITTPTLDKSNSNNNNFDNNVDLASMTPAERRRHERNMREQQRSYRISQQIKQLRNVLEENKIPFKPNKFSILVSVVEYIKQLQARAIMLDSEHARLVETIRQTNELVQNGTADKILLSSDDEEAGDTSETGGDGPFRLSSSSSSSLVPSATCAYSNFTSGENWLVKGGLDYAMVFENCPAALGIASLDGRVLSCNTAFEDLLCVRRNDIQVQHQSMFMYIRNHQDIFEAMADLLKRSSNNATVAAVVGADSSGASASGSSDNKPSQQRQQQQQVLLFWCGYVISLQDKKLAFSITLTNTANGDPKYFSLSAAELCPTTGALMTTTITT